MSKLYEDRKFLAVRLELDFWKELEKYLKKNRITFNQYASEVIKKDFERIKA
jgi:hypothetical protein